MTGIGRTIAESTPHPTPLPRPRAGAPNVVVVVLDDVGFAQLGCFGSNLDTPTIDGLAAGGLRYRSFHVTAMCSPTRAATLTGRNHHQVGFGFLPEVPTGFPGYNARIPRSAAALPRLLRDAGYATFAVGKWHLTPRWEANAGGPFGQWPLGLGFERYYGFLSGDANQFAPELVRDNGFVEPPAGPHDGYHLSEDLADQAIRFVVDHRQHQPGKPFLLWFATGAAHAPHQAPPAWLASHAGRFDAGWDAWREEVLTRQRALGIVPADADASDRPAWVTPWADLPTDEQRLYARMMEVYAGFLSHADAQIGRVVSTLASLGVLDNTIICVLSDNGASAEGGPTGSFNEHRFTHDRLDDLDDTLARIGELGGPTAYGHYPWGWAWAGNTPFKLWKRYTWLGGVRTPLVVHWPAGIAARGEVRSQFCHAVDLLPTLLDVTGVEAPASVDGVDQLPLAGRSLRATFDDPEAPAPRSTQYFELLGSRAMYVDGWKATTDHVGQQISVERERLEGSHRFEDDTWSLYRIDDDFAEVHDLADAEPARLAAMVERWWAEAGANQVLPLDDTFIGRAIAMDPNPWPARPTMTYRVEGGPVAEDLLPPLGVGFDLTADVAIAAGSTDHDHDDAARDPLVTPPGTPHVTTEGVIAALGDWNNGFALYVLDGRLVGAFNLFGALTRVEAPAPLAPGEHTVGLHYQRASGGTERRVALSVDGATVAAAELADDLPMRWQIGGTGLSVGRDRGLPVCDDYRAPFAFTGTLEAVTVASHALGAVESAPDAADVARFLHHE